MQLPFTQFAQSAPLFTLDEVRKLYKKDERNRHPVEHRPLWDEAARHQVGPFDPARPHVGVVLLHVPEELQEGLPAISPVAKKEHKAKSAAEEEK